MVTHDAKPESTKRPHLGGTIDRSHRLALGQRPVRVRTQSENLALACFGPAPACILSCERALTALADASTVGEGYPDVVLETFAATRGDDPDGHASLSGSRTIGVRIR